jgi:GNAT superfamily N-acetyltransferase
MRFVIEPDATAFAPRGLAWMERDALLNTLPATIAGSRLGGPRAGDTGQPLWITVESDDGEVIGAAVRTPPRAVVLPAIPPEMAAELADFVPEVPVTGVLPGVTGPVAQASAFADRWAAVTGCGVRTRTRMRLYRMAALVPPPAGRGSWRLADENDFDLCFDWFVDFPVAAGHVTGPPAEVADVRERLAGRRIGLWEIDGEPVSLAGWTLPASGVVRIGPVYTPRQHQRRGYGTAATAAATAGILATGAEACLFTDLSNPTSNSIYQKIGYRPVADFVELVFE